MAYHIEPGAHIGYLQLPLTAQPEWPATHVHLFEIRVVFVLKQI